MKKQSMSLVDLLNQSIADRNKAEGKEPDKKKKKKDGKDMSVKLIPRKK